MKTKVKATTIFIMLLVFSMAMAYCNSTELKIIPLDKEKTAIDNTRWRYNEDDNVYYQLGICYAENPKDIAYETLAIFVPGAYLNAAANGDGTYTATVNPDGQVNGYTSSTAPIVIPVETPGYSAMKSAEVYVRSCSSYTDQGFVYVYTGCRGRGHGAPAGITDMKAAIRYLRHASSSIPGDTERIFTFGMSGGGAQSALLGTTGNSSLYDPYLEDIGAIMDERDDVYGSMCWCPIAGLDTANEAYEWNLGHARKNMSYDEIVLSRALADEFASYVNESEFQDEDGNILTLEMDGNGNWRKGSYYDYTKRMVEESLNSFLSITAFPYTRVTNTMVQGYVNENGEIVNDGIDRGFMNNPTVTTYETFDTVQDYIADLNKNEVWVHYDEDTKTANIESLEAFVRNCKEAEKSVGSFDNLTATQGENELFGYGDGIGRHFDPTLGKLLEGTEWESSFAEDLSLADSLGSSVDMRVNMYNPLYYIHPSYEGYKTSDVAPFFRIRVGIAQSDTALSTEMNLYLALAALGINVDYASIWEQKHVMAETSGTSTEAFIAWVNNTLST